MSMAMRYERDPVAATALPDAPMVMPKQRLERQHNFKARLRHVLAALPWL